MDRARRMLARSGALALIACLLGGRSTSAQQQAVVAVSGSPAPMRVQGAVAGSAPSSVIDASTTYTVATLGNPKKITAQLDSPMPAGVTLSATFDAPSNWVSFPNVQLDATPRDVVTSIDHTTGTTRSITYVLTATPAAGIVPPQSRTVTLTIVSMP